VLVGLLAASSAAARSVDEDFQGGGVEWWKKLARRFELLTC
jgi:hypothetical protein